MQVAGIIAEYNPFHRGHLYHLARTRALLGQPCAVVCAMGGNFTQRGEFAVARKHLRAEAAIRGGADLVLELPLVWAVSSAERFADGGVQVLEKTGVVTHLSFGSESADAAALGRAARALLSPEFPARLRRELTVGDSFPAARQRAAEQLLGPEGAAVLQAPNDLLGVEYCKALFRRDSSMEALAVRRAGMGHHGGGEEDGPASASAIRGWLREDRFHPHALAAMAPAMAELYRREEGAGRAPVFAECAERAVLARLRTMGESDFAALDQGREGLYHRLYAASRAGAPLADVCERAKTKRYTAARLRRMLLWAYLGLTPGDFPGQVPYLRLLAANETGRRLLAAMRKTSAVPVLTKPADVRLLDGAARELFALEARATDLYTLAYPQLSAAKGGGEWREGPVIL